MKLNEISQYFFQIDTSKNGVIESSEIEAAKQTSSIFSSILEVDINFATYMQKAINTFRDNIEIEDSNAMKNLPYQLQPSSATQSWNWEPVTKVLTKDEVDAKPFRIKTAENTTISQDINFNNSDGEYMLKHLSFDDDTFKNTPAENLPKDFKPDEIIEKGRDAGCNTKAMHEMGYTGKGIKVAIIDTPILANHESIKSSIVGYEVMNNDLANGNEAYYHGQAVADILVGKKDGIAPDSKLVYFSGADSTADRLQALRRIVEIDKKSSPEDKIKVLSISWDIEVESDGEQIYNEYNNLLKQLHNDGVFISIAGFSMLNKDINGVEMDYGSLKKKSQNGNPDDYSNYTGYSGFRLDNPLLIPAGDRTVASARGENEYRHDSKYSTSWTVPALAGFYTCALQCATENGIELTPAKFYELAKETGQPIFNENNDETGRAIDAKALCEKIIELAKSEHSFGI